MGFPTPAQKLVEPFAANAPTCTQAAPVAGGKVVPFPVPSQVSVGVGNASLNDGFTPANMTPLNQGGEPMSGPDLQGALFLISSPVTSFCAGNIRYPFDSVYAAAIGGYDKGAQVQDATDATLSWTSLVAANSVDPATANQTAWFASRSLYSTSSLAAGTYANNTLPGASDYFLDITATGAVVLNGFVAVRDGQKLVISNVGTGTIQIGALSGTAGNQVRLSSAITLLQNDSITIQWVKAIGASGAWVQV